MAKRIRNNRFDVEWQFAKECWASLVAGRELPPIPSYSIFEKDDESTKPERLVATKSITPNKVTFNGVSYYG